MSFLERKHLAVDKFKERLLATVHVEIQRKKHQKQAAVAEGKSSYRAK